jgi:carbonic anhydrase
MKKTLIYICGDVQLKDRALNFLNTTREEVITIQSNVASDLQPFGSVVKSILVTAYKENVTDVYIVVSQIDKHEIHESEMREWLENEGVEQDTFEIFDYLDKFSKHTLSDWLAVKTVEKTLNKNLAMLKSHPFLPKKLSFKGLILDAQHEFTII